MSTPLSVLIVEDSASDAALVVRQLTRDGFEVAHERIENAARMRAALGERAWDVVLSDFNVPGFGAIPALKLLRELKLDIPFIVVSGVIGEEAAVALMKAGAHDCVMKDQLARLAPAVAREISEAQGRLALRRTEEALRERDAIFSHFMEHSPIHVFFKDQDIRAIRLSKNYEAMLGKPLAELLGKNMDDLFPSDLAKRMVADDMKVLQEGRLVTVEEELNGRQYSTIKFPIVIEGKARYLAGYTMDITERKQAEAALKASEIRFKTIFNEAPMGIALIDSVTGHIHAANPMFAKIAGRSMEEMADIDWMSITHPDDVQQDLDNMALLNAGKISGFQMEKRYLKRDGAPVWISMTVAPVLAGAEAHAHHLCMIEDISQRKRQAHDLEESEARFRGLIEQSLTGIYISQDSVFRYANPRLEQMLGYGPGQMVGVRIDDIVLAEDLPILFAEREKLRAGAGSISYELRARRMDGEIITLGLQGSVYQFNGEPATVGMAQDISEKIRAEEQIKRYIEQLKTAFRSTVEVATSLSELRDPYTAGHERRVAEIAVALGTELGLDEHRLEGLRVAGHLHDVGKITIPAEILSKPGKLSPIEFKLIQAHADAGYEVLKKVEFPWPVAEVALQHHERMDGSGYPHGLMGEAIRFEARIIAVADVIEAMSSHRPYRPGLGISAALAEIERGRGKLYDARVADVCLRLFHEKGYTVPE